jgi:CheY-like chemotaxis protein
MTKAPRPATPAAFLENLSKESAGVDEFLSFVDEAVDRSLGAPGGKRRRVAVIDDDPALVEIFTRLLEPDHDVLSAASGVAGLALILANKPDLVLLDVRMPDMDGIEVLERVKLTFPAMAVLLVTAARDLNLSKRALALGASGYILKPFDLTHVRALVEKALPPADA